MNATPQDYITAIEQQRNSALNEVVNLRAALAAASREIEGLRAELGVVEAEEDQPADMGS